MDIEKLKYPIGKHVSKASWSTTEIQHNIAEIAAFPNRLMQLTQPLSVEQLNWKYRPNGWTIKQVVHHCSDSHMNSMIRFKLALTENQPTIRPYMEDKWAALPDSLDNNISHSLSLLSALHKKWALLLNSLTQEQLQLTFTHPENQETITLAENIGIYAWHGNHHLAHIQNAITNKGAF